MLPRNVGKFSLGCKRIVAGHARSDLRADGDALLCPAASDAVHAPGSVWRNGVPALDAGWDALPSCDGTAESAAGRIAWRFVTSQR